MGMPSTCVSAGRFRAQEFIATQTAQVVVDSIMSMPFFLH